MFHALPFNGRRRVQHEKHPSIEPPFYGTFLGCCFQANERRVTIHAENLTDATSVFQTASTWPTRIRFHQDTHTGSYFYCTFRQEPDGREWISSVTSPPSGLRPTTPARRLDAPWSRSDNTCDRQHIVLAVQNFDDIAQFEWPFRYYRFFVRQIHCRLRSYTFLVKNHLQQLSAIQTLKKTRQTATELGGSQTHRQPSRKARSDP